MNEIYLDNSATTKCFPEVAGLMSKIMLEEYGNPSSMHHKGVEAETHVRNAKKILAKILKVSERTLFFTSCGSESDNMAIIGGAHANHRNGKHLITTQIEHPAVLESMRFLENEGYEVTYLPADENGRVTPQQVEDAVREDTILVSIMHVNNEIGAVEPIAEIGERIKAKNPKTLFHVDAVQSFGKMQIFPAKMHVDMLSASGHKIHGPKGVGLLYIKEGVKVNPLILGGGQQKGMRSGTENTAGIAGMALAAKMLYDHLDEDTEKLYAMKAELIDAVRELPDVHVNGAVGRDSAPHIVSLSVGGIRAEVLLHALEEKNIYVSSGSACATNRPHLSATLEAIGEPKEYMDATIRLSLSVMNTPEEMKEAADAICGIVPFLRKFTRH